MLMQHVSFYLFLPINDLSVTVFHLENQLSYTSYFPFILVIPNAVFFLPYIELHILLLRQWVRVTALLTASTVQVLLAASLVCSSFSSLYLVHKV